MTRQRSSTTAKSAALRLLVAAIVLGTVLAGCLGRSPVVDHYILGTRPGATNGDRVGAGAAQDAPFAGRTRDLAVLVGPVRLPAYLERAQMARLEAHGQIGLSEFSRWLGGFEENFLRGLSLGLARELDSIRVVGFPSTAPFPLDYRVRLHVDDLVRVAREGVLRIRIRWSLSQEGADGPARLFLMEEERPLRDASSEALVEAHEAALAELARRIAVEIDRLEAARVPAAP